MAIATRQLNIAIPAGLFTRAKKCAKDTPVYFKAWVIQAVRAKVEAEEGQKAAAK